MRACVCFTLAINPTGEKKQDSQYAGRGPEGREEVGQRRLGGDCRNAQHATAILHQLTKLELTSILSTIQHRVQLINNRIALTDCVRVRAG